MKKLLLEVPVDPLIASAVDRNEFDAEIKTAIQHRDTNYGSDGGILSDVLISHDTLLHLAALPP